jgi:hypothetical protein
MAWDLLVWDWFAMGRMFLSAGAATVCVQLLSPIIRDRHRSRRHAAYMAMRLAVVLEAYAEGCAVLIQENARAKTPPHEQVPDWTTTLPVPPCYPDDVDGWKAIDHNLADRCLSFESRSRQSQAIIASAIYHDLHQLRDKVESQATDRGLEAWALAVEMRKRHRLRPITPVWDYANELRGLGAKRHAPLPPPHDR